MYIRARQSFLGKVCTPAAEISHGWPRHVWHDWSPYERQPTPLPRTNFRSSWRAGDPLDWQLRARRDRQVFRSTES